MLRSGCKTRAVRLLFGPTPPGLKSNHVLGFTSLVFWLKLMRCSSCRVFTGPVCGACRAGHRILGILQSGQVPLLEERRVTGLLRGVAGELADLVESSQLSGGPAPRAGSPGRGEQRT